MNGYLFPSENTTGTSIDLKISHLLPIVYAFIQITIWLYPRSFLHLFTVASRHTYPLVLCGFRDAKMRFVYVELSNRRKQKRWWVQMGTGYVHICTVLDYVAWSYQITNTSNSFTNHWRRSEQKIRTFKLSSFSGWYASISTCTCTYVRLGTKRSYMYPSTYCSAHNIQCKKLVINRNSVYDPFNETGAKGTWTYYL